MTTMERGVAWGGPAPGLVDVYVRSTDSTWTFDPIAAEPPPPPGAVKVTAYALDYDVFSAYYSRGEPVLLFQEGRRWVALPARNGVATGVPILRDIPQGPAASLTTWTAEYDHLTRTATPVTMTLGIGEFGHLTALHGGISGTPPSWMGSYMGGMGGTCTGTGSGGLTSTTSSIGAVGRWTNVSRLRRGQSAGIARAESSVPTGGWIVDGTGTDLSTFIPPGSMCVSYGYAYTVPRDWMDVPPVQFRTLDADAAFLCGGGYLWDPDNYPNNLDELFFVTGGAVWVMGQGGASGSLTFGTFEWRGSSGYLVPESRAGINVAWVPPVEHAG